MSTRCYDVVALLNDRDTDSILGPELYRTLLDYFLNLSEGSKTEILAEYWRVLLQRDLKVAGRFRKLSRSRGLVSYERWVPGTLTRIGRTLRTLAGEDPLYAAFLEMLVARDEFIRAGSKEPS